MGSGRKKRVWEVDTLYGTEDIRPYFGGFAALIAAGMFLIVQGLLVTETEAGSDWSKILIGAVFAFIGGVMLPEVYSKYRKLNRPDRQEPEYPEG